MVNNIDINKININFFSNKDGLAGTWNKNLCNMSQAYIISSSLIFIITITILTCEKLNKCSNSNTCLPYYVKPVHYHIQLHTLQTFDSYSIFEFRYFRFKGESSTIINILQTTKYIKLCVKSSHISRKNNIN